MFAIRLNLLAPRKKKRAHDLIRFLFLKHIMEIVLLMLCVASAALLLGLNVLEVNFSTLAESFAATSPERAQVRQEAARINQRINQINAVQKEFVPWSMVLATVAELTPQEITWNSWHFDRTTGRAELTGLALTRESVLTLEEQLKQKEWIASIELPLADLVSIKEKPFAITLILTLKDLRY